jgi:parallel beta-helix repeat protein
MRSLLVRRFTSSSRLSITGVLGAALLGPSLALVIGASAASASSSDLYVATTGTDTGSCTTQASPCLTIGYAVSQTSPGDNVYVAAGTYAESVSIDSDINLYGAQSGVAATSGRSVVSNESVIQAPAGSQGPIVYGSGASTGVVDGFTLDGNNSTNNPTGISAFGSAGTGYTWVDNIIENNAMGINFNASGAGDTSTLISGNLFRDNNATPSNGDTGTGIFFTNGPSNNVTIEANTFQDEGLTANGGGNADINTTGPGSGSPSSTNLVVDDNTEILDNTSGHDTYDNNFLALFIADGVQVSNNTITDSDATDPNADSAIYVGGGVSNATFSDNTISGGLATGINLTSDFYPAGSNDVVTGNTISDRSNGIRVRGDEFGSNPANIGYTISDNTIFNVTNDGIWAAAGSEGTISNNTVTNAGNFACEDDTTGSGTSGTADTWQINTGATSSPAGLCAAPVPPAAPEVTRVNPNQGPVAGGQTVTITGTGLASATAVHFGGTAATDVTPLSNDEITAVSPADSAQTVDVTVTSPSGTSTITTDDHYTYFALPVVKRVKPHSGSPSGGRVVTITGSNFGGTQMVDFGSTPDTDFTVVSARKIKVTSPAGSPGTVNVTVVTPGGTSAPAARGTFTYS